MILVSNYDNNFIDCTFFVVLKGFLIRAGIELSFDDVIWAPGVIDDGVRLSVGWVENCTVRNTHLDASDVLSQSNFNKGILADLMIKIKLWALGLIYYPKIHLIPI